MYSSKQFVERYLCYSIRVCRLGREEKERTMDLAVFEFCTRSLKKRWRLKHTPTRFRFMPAQKEHVLYKCIVYIRRFLQMLDRGELRSPNLAVVVALGRLLFRSRHVLGAVGGPLSDGCPEAGYWRRYGAGWSTPSCTVSSVLVLLRSASERCASPSTSTMTVGPQLTGIRCSSGRAGIVRSNTQPQQRSCASTNRRRSAV
jgi:hypothetical protein